MVTERENEIKKVFTSYLKLIARRTNDKITQVEAVVFYSRECDIEFRAKGSVGYLLDEIDNSKVKNFQIRDIIGFSKTVALQSLKINLQEEFKEVLQKIIKEKNVQPGRLNIRVKCTDDFGRKLQLYLYDANELKEELEWQYIS